MVLFWIFVDISTENFCYFTAIVGQNYEVFGLSILFFLKIQRRRHHTCDLVHFFFSGRRSAKQGDRLGAGVTMCGIG